MACERSTRTTLAPSRSKLIISSVPENPPPTITIGFADEGSEVMYGRGSLAGSDHEESVGPIAFQLADKSIFPVKIVLHRDSPIVSALIGPLVAPLRPALWWGAIGAGRDLAGSGAIENEDLPAHLGQQR